MFIFLLANFFCYQWQEIEAGITDSERYYSLMAASIIIGELVKDDLLASRETRTAIINKLGWNVRV